MVSRYRIFILLSVFSITSYLNAEDSIKTLFIQGNYDALISVSFDEGRNFTDEEHVLIAKSFEAKGDRTQALRRYLMLLENGNRFPGHLQTVWQLMDASSRNEFVPNYFNRFGFSNELFDMYFYGRSQYNEEQLVSIIEAYHTQKYFTEQSAVFDFLCDFYLKKGLLKEKIQQFSENVFLSAFLAVSAGDTAEFIRYYNNCDVVERQLVISVILKHKKKEFLKTLYNSGGLSGTREETIFEIITKGITDEMLMLSDSSRQRYIIERLLDFDDISHVATLLDSWDPQRKKFNDLRGNLLLKKGDLIGAFYANHDWYVQTSVFNDLLFQDLVKTVDITRIAINDDEFWVKMANVYRSKLDYSGLLDVIKKVIKDSNKATLLKIVAAQLPYRLFATQLYELSPLTRITNFSTLMMDNMDKRLVDDTAFIEKTTFFGKEALLGDIYLFLENNEKKAFQWYSAISNNQERAYKIVLYHFILGNFEEVEKSIPVVNPQYKAAMLMSGDVLVFRGNTDEALKKYIRFLDTGSLTWLRNDAQQRILWYYTDKQALTSAIASRGSRAEFILWR